MMKTFIKLLFFSTAIFFCSSLFAKTYTLAIPFHPWKKQQTQLDIQKAYMPLQLWLEKKTGYRFKIIGYQLDETVFTKLAHNRYDVAFIKVFPFLLAKAKNKHVTSLATVTTWNTDHTKKIICYNGYILTSKKNTTIHAWNNLKGKTFGFVDPYSASGFLYPVEVMKQHNINYKKFFKKFVFLENHLAVMNAILDHSVDAGAVWDSAYLNSPNRDQYKVISIITNIPNPLFAASGDLPDAAKQRIQQALLSAPESVTKNLVFAGFVKTPKNFYHRFQALPVMKK